MPRPKKSYDGRPINELASLPDFAPVTVEEFCYWKQISLSKYWRDRRAGTIPPVHFVDQSRNGQRHTAAEMRETFGGSDEAA